MDALLSMILFTIISIVLEWILLFVVEISTNKALPQKILRAICKCVLVCSILFYIAITIGISLISVYYFRCGDVTTGMKMAITAVVVIVSVYYLFLRIPIRKVRAMR